MANFAVLKCYLKKKNEKQKPILFGNVLNVVLHF